jgi:sulfofructose kinase
MDMKEQKVSIAGGGICCQDYLVIAQWPEHQGKTIHMKDMVVQGGGLVATALVAAARLSASCHFWSLLGDDRAGNDILDELRLEKIDTSQIVKIAGGGSPFSVIHVDEKTGERTIFHRRAAGLSWQNHDLLDGIRRCNVLLVDDYYLDLSIAAAQVARREGIPIVADATPNARNRQLLQQVDVMIAPQDFVRENGYQDNLDGALDAIHKIGPTTAVITLGKNGWICSDQRGRGRGSAYPVEVVDTTGAGDVFHGAFAYGLARGWDTEQCCDFAAATAGLKCTQTGGRTGIPTLPKVLSFLKTHSQRNWAEKC